jgi:hypothetical protein
MGGIIRRRLCLTARRDAASRWGRRSTRGRSHHDRGSHDRCAAIVGTIEARAAETIAETESKPETGGRQARAVETIGVIRPIETIGSVKAGAIGSVRSIAVVRLVESTVMITSVTTAWAVSVRRR